MVWWGYHLCSERDETCLSCDSWVSKAHVYPFIQDGLEFKANLITGEVPGSIWYILVEFEGAWRGIEVDLGVTNVTTLW